MSLRLTLSTLAICAAFGAQAADRDAVMDTYADIAHAGYEDSLTTAKELKSAIDEFVADPTEAKLDAAKDAWKAARIPYQQTEAFRFGNPLVDEWEGKVNAWPLDEGLIDYVEGDHGTNEENPYAAANIVANPTLNVNGESIDATEITPALLESLQEVGGIEANVATGYHAIEFLLWGQDLNGTGPGAGARKASDYSVSNCTNGNCERRGAYLTAAAELLVSDLEDAVEMWSESGEARAQATADADKGLVMAFTGLGSLSYGEQAGERMKLGLLLHDPEEEHDCFSDNTHISHYYDGLGIRNVYSGSYKRIDGSMVEGPSLQDVVAEQDPALADKVLSAMDHTMDKLDAIKTSAENGVAYDQLLAIGNEEGGAKVQAAIDGLIAQTRELERAVAAIGAEGVTIEGSDSLDNVDAVLQ